MKKSWLSTLLILFFSLTPARASERLLVLSYDVYVGGIKVVKLALEADIGSRQYSVDIIGNLIFQHLFSWQMDLSSEGKIIEGFPFRERQA